MNHHYRNFKSECYLEIKKQGSNQDISKLTQEWVDKVSQLKYSYHFEWMDRPIIQYPQDMVAMQELIWAVKPDLIISAVSM